MIVWLHQQQVRLWSCGILAHCLSILWVAATLTPSPDGIGTHRQLGYPPCLGPILTGYPCPTCGMTTAFAYASQGMLLRAFHAQPAGWFFFIAVVAACVVSLRAMLTNQAPSWPGFVHTRNIIIFVGCVTALGWVYKLLTFEL